MPTAVWAKMAFPHLPNLNLSEITELQSPHKKQLFGVLVDDPKFSPCPEKNYWKASLLASSSFHHGHWFSFHWAIFPQSLPLFSWFSIKMWKEWIWNHIFMIWCLLLILMAQSLKSTCTQSARWTVKITTYRTVPFPSFPSSQWFFRFGQHDFFALLKYKTGEGLGGLLGGRFEKGGLRCSLV